MVARGRGGDGKMGEGGQKVQTYSYKISKPQEYYSAIKRNEIELFVVRWMDLESVIQSEVCQKEKNKYRMLTHIYDGIGRVGGRHQREEIWGYMYMYS